MVLKCWCNATLTNTFQNYVIMSTFAKMRKMPASPKTSMHAKRLVPEKWTNIPFHCAFPIQQSACRVVYIFVAQYWDNWSCVVCEVTAEVQEV